jgi:glutathione synthase/RimK-type ligase-like ATP-grasp enzyme
MYKIYLPQHCKGYDTILFSKLANKYLNTINVRNTIVNDVNQINKGDIVVFRFGSDYMNGKYANTSECSKVVSEHISSIEEKGCICYPSSNLMKYYENKEMLMKLFVDKNVKIPESFFISSIQDYLKMKNEIIQHMPIIMKVCYSCSSNNIDQAYSIDELDTKITNHFKNNGGSLLLQRKIMFTKEARLTYVGNNIYHGYYRLKPDTNKVSGATPYGSVISFDIDLNRLKPFINDFVEKTGFYIGGIDICWENDDINSSPYVLEVSPIYDINPPPIHEYKNRPYKEFKKTKEYITEKENVYYNSCKQIFNYFIEINTRPVIYCDIDCTISDSEPRIKKWANNCNYQLYEHIINDNPIDGAIDALDKLSKKYKIILITGRKSFRDYKKSTVDWLYKWNFKYHSIIYTYNIIEKMNFVDKNSPLIDDFTTNHHDVTMDDISSYNKYIENGYNIIKFTKDTNNWNSILQKLL